VTVFVGDMTFLLKKHAHMKKMLFAISVSEALFKTSIYRCLYWTGSGRKKTASLSAILAGRFFVGEVIRLRF